jgi:hypothetical protein
VTPIDASKSIEAKIPAASGKPVLVQRDPKCSGHASSKIASDEDPAQVQRYCTFKLDQAIATEEKNTQG